MLTAAARRRLAECLAAPQLCLLRRRLCANATAQEPLALLSVDAASGLLAAVQGSDAAWKAAAAVVPGACLDVHVPTAATVAVHTGPSGVFHVAVESPGLGGVHLEALTTWEVTPRGYRLALAPAPSGPRPHVRVWIPERFHGVSILSGGAVAVDRVTEGDVDLRLLGPHGTATLGTLKCGNVHIRTGGGAVHARMLSGDAVGVHTAGGALSCDRLVGRRVALVTSSGEIKLTAALVERMRAYAGQTAVHTLRIGTSTRLSAASGAGITVRAVDGEPDATLHAVTGGGEVDVGLEAPAAAFGGVHLHSGGGDVTLAVPSDWAAPLRCIAGIVDGQPMRHQHMALPQEAAVLQGRKGAAVAALSVSAPRLGPVNAAGSPGVAVDAGAGNVRLRLRSWLDMALGSDRASGLRATVDDAHRQ